MLAFLQSLVTLIDTFFIPLFFAVAFLLFIWGVFLYFILGAGNDEKRKEGRSFVVYGIIGFVIMVSLWGIVALLTSTLGFGNQNRPPLPFEQRGTTPQQQPSFPAGA